MVAHCRVPIDLIEEAFHVIALSIEKRTEADWVSPVSFRRDVCTRSTLSRKSPDCIGIVGPVGEQHAVVAKLRQQIAGEYLSRCANITPVEGLAPDTTLIAVIKFTSMDAAQGFIKDPDYSPDGKARQQGSESHFYIIDDTDVASSISYLSKAES